MTSRDNNCIRESIDWVIARLAGSGGLERLWEKWWAAPLSCTSEEDAVAEAEVELAKVGEGVRRRQRQLTQDAGVVRAGRAGRAGRADEGTLGDGNGGRGVSGGVRRALRGASVGGGTSLDTDDDGHRAMTLVDMFGLYVLWLVVTALVIADMLLRRRAMKMVSTVVQEGTKNLPSITQSIENVQGSINLVEQSAKQVAVFLNGDGEANSGGEGDRRVKSEGEVRSAGVLNDVESKVMLEKVLHQLSMLTAAQSATAVALELQQASPGIPVQARQRPTCTPEPASTLSLSVERSASYCQASRHDVMAGRRHNA